MQFTYRESILREMKDINEQVVGCGNVVTVIGQLDRAHCVCLSYIPVPIIYDIY